MESVTAALEAAGDDLGEDVGGEFVGFPRGRILAPVSEASSLKQALGR